LDLGGFEAGAKDGEFAFGFRAAAEGEEGFETELAGVPILTEGGGGVEGGEGFGGVIVLEIDGGEGAAGVGIRGNGGDEAGKEDSGFFVRALHGPFVGAFGDEVGVFFGPSGHG